MNSLQAAHPVRKVIEENIPAFEARYGCRPEVLILNPVVALALFGGVPEYDPVMFRGYRFSSARKWMWFDWR
ncbi:hypothetical protein [Paraburkholderia dilworthii]|uniref:hypothetical protein n=1 Tax=Paraburkholderia dilworthii TaxID=948106 RepID=UPI00042070FD|nr:hypothetical protein [Paraburkholderia dilworthii]